MKPINAPTLARPGPRWGAYPERNERARARRPGRVSPRAQWRQQLRQAAPHQTLHATRQALQRHGLTPETVAAALGLVLHTMERTHQITLHDTQLTAATGLLNQQLIEMATGEGKTLVLASAAAVAGLSGVPVHVITANDYLAERDAQALAPLYKALELSVGQVAPDMSPEQRRQAYACDVVYVTAKELAFDYLRDVLARSASTEPAPPVLRGLCMALLDEADSVLLDEATVPLIISGAQQCDAAHQAHRRAVWWQALQLARRLHGHEWTTDPHRQRADVTAQGDERLVGTAESLGGVWRRPRLRRELLSLALTALHALQRDHHYLVRQGQIELLDATTGRVATGRVWSQGLHALIELKEGCTPSGPTQTLAQVTFQRFFQRYWFLGGLSGTLAEARGELHAVDGLDVVRVAERLPSRRQVWPDHVFDTKVQRWLAVVGRVRELQTQHRPTLIGTDSVTDSEQLSAHLTEAGVAHTVLNARHDHNEALVVAKAGQAGQVTVATRMAGRGTDIALAPIALSAGGLHVINCQRNESRRLDRQLAGRCARQGQPGSTETWICAGISADRSGVNPPKLVSCNPSAPLRRFWTAPWRWWHVRLPQWLEERRHAALRRQLLDQDRQWAQQHHSARHGTGPST